MIKVAAREQHQVNHPEHDYPGPDILVFREPASRMACGGLHARNAVVMSNNALDWSRPETWTGMLDRSPCGTGTSARMAQRHAKGLLKVGEDYRHESIIGSIFDGRVEAETSVGNKPAIVPSISGWARMHGLNTIFVDERDPFMHGFILK